MGKREKSEEIMIKSNRQIALTGVLIALAMILSYVESFIPVSNIVPGIKLGLANLVTIIALRKLGVKKAVMISLGRIILSGVLFGNLAVIAYSLAGAATSILIMVLVGRCKVFSVIGVSICGGVAHNAGQLLVAAIVLENIRVVYYMAVLGLTGAIAGTLIGILAGYIMKRIRFY